MILLQQWIGIYFRCQKSSDFNIQCETFCTYKHYNLVKTMPIMTMNGKFIETFGPFNSDNDNNDEQIYNLLFDKSKEIDGLCKKLKIDRSVISLIDTKKSIRIVDRGFIRQKR